MPGLHTAIDTVFGDDLDGATACGSQNFSLSPGLCHARERRDLSLSAGKKYILSLAR
jgi:hypothetical protein